MSEAQKPHSRDDVLTLAREVLNPLAVYSVGTDWHGTVGLLARELLDLEEQYEEMARLRDGYRADKNTAIASLRRLEEQLETLRNVAPEALARTFHEAYERLAPVYQYETRPESAVAWENVPQTNRALMCAVAGEVLLWLRGESSPASEPG